MTTIFNNLDSLQVLLCRQAIKNNELDNSFDIETILYNVRYLCKKNYYDYDSLLALRNDYKKEQRFIKYDDININKLENRNLIQLIKIINMILNIKKQIGLNKHNDKYNSDFYNMLFKESDLFCLFSIQVRHINN